MAIVTDIIQKFFGNKSDRDIRAVMPMVDKIKEEYEKVVKLTNDQLRAKTIEIRQKIISEMKKNRSSG